MRGKMNSSYRQVVSSLYAALDSLHDNGKTLNSIGKLYAMDSGAQRRFKRFETKPFYPVEEYSRRRLTTADGLRPPIVLEKTMHYLVHYFLRDPPKELNIHDLWLFLWNRFRQIRTDWTRQVATNGGGEENLRHREWLEYMIRVLILQSVVRSCTTEALLQEKRMNLQSIQDCAGSIVLYYRQNNHRCNVDILSAILLFNALQQMEKTEADAKFCKFNSATGTFDGDEPVSPHAFRELLHRPSLVRTEPIANSMKFLSAVRQRQWFRVFALCRELNFSLLQRCIISNSITYLRFRAMVHLVTQDKGPALARVRGTIDTQRLSDLLLFETPQHLLLFLRALGLEAFLEDNKQLLRVAEERESKLFPVTTEARINDGLEHKASLLFPVAASFLPSENAMKSQDQFCPPYTSRIHNVHLVSVDNETVFGPILRWFQGSSGNENGLGECSMNPDDFVDVLSQEETFTRASSDQVNSENVLLNLNGVSLEATVLYEMVRCSNEEPMNRKRLEDAEQQEIKGLQLTFSNEAVIIRGKPQITAACSNNRVCEVEDSSAVLMGQISTGASKEDNWLPENAANISGTWKHHFDSTPFPHWKNSPFFNDVNTNIRSHEEARSISDPCPKICAPFSSVESDVNSSVTLTHSAKGVSAMESDENSPLFESLRNGKNITLKIRNLPELPCGGGDSTSWLQTIQQHHYEFARCIFFSPKLLQLASRCALREPSGGYSMFGLSVEMSTIHSLKLCTDVVVTGSNITEKSMVWRVFSMLLQRTSVNSVDSISEAQFVVPSRHGERISAVSSVAVHCGLRDGCSWPLAATFVVVARLSLEEETMRLLRTIYSSVGGIVLVVEGSKKRFEKYLNSFSRCSYRKQDEFSRKDGRYNLEFSPRILVVETKGCNGNFSGNTDLGVAIALYRALYQLVCEYQSAVKFFVET